MLQIVGYNICIGGQDGNALQTAAYQYNGHGWNILQSLLTARAGHRSIALGNEIMHIGGVGNM